MKAEKVTVNITIECLSIDSVGGLLSQVAREIDMETESGSLSKSDGDYVGWETTRDSVKF